MQIQRQTADRKLDSALAPQPDHFRPDEDDANGCERKMDAERKATDKRWKAPEHSERPRVWQTVTNGKQWVVAASTIVSATVRQGYEVMRLYRASCWFLYFILLAISSGDSKVG